MFFDKGLFGKMPVAVQAVLGLVLFVFGVYLAIFSDYLSNGSPQFFILFISVGVIYIATGMPPLLEGVMTMVYQQKEPQKDL